eukprot:66770_1
MSYQQSQSQNNYNRVTTICGNPFVNNFNCPSTQQNNYSPQSAYRAPQINDYNDPSNNSAPPTLSQQQCSNQPAMISSTNTYITHNATQSSQFEYSNRSNNCTRNVNQCQQCCEYITRINQLINLNAALQNKLKFLEHKCNEYYTDWQNQYYLSSQSTSENTTKAFIHHITNINSNDAIDQTIDKNHKTSEQQFECQSKPSGDLEMQQEKKDEHQHYDKSIYTDNNLSTIFDDKYAIDIVLVLCNQYPQIETWLQSMEYHSQVTTSTAHAVHFLTSLMVKK